MKRKTVAVCVTGYDWEYESRIVNGIYMRCTELDVNLLVFANLMRRPEINSTRTLPESAARGEEEIYNLINYDLVDGIIILGDSMIEERIIANVSQRAEQHNVPIVNVNDSEHKLFRNVLLSDEKAMEFVVRHLVKDHGYTKINFIGGFPGNLQTEERLAAYKRVLSEYNIPIEEERIAYGEFWKKSIECTEKFLEAPELPQAIVCASDTMAFFCMDTIKEKGLKVPEDIAVTGFDGIEDCVLYDPPLTSVRRDFQGSGIAAVDILNDIWNGKETPEEVSVDSVLIRSGSCGCTWEKKNTNFYNSVYGEQNRFKEFNSYVLEMNTKFSCAETSAELYAETKKIAEFFKLKKLYICICSNIEQGAICFDDLNPKAEYTGLSEKMVSMLEFGHSVPVGTEFCTKEFVPENFLEGEKAVMYAFSPMYFKNSFLGYLAYEPSCIKGNGNLFETWLMNISNNAGSFYMNRELEYVVDKLQNLYIRDPLTGLYNRRGMKQLGYNIIDKVKKNGGEVTIFCADIDNLKPINDEYGHEGGDNAILQTARAIEAAMPKGSICVRTGGDEFCVICGGADSIFPERCIAAVDEYLEKYNRCSGLKYKVGCSCGYKSLKAEELMSIDAMINAADENMYKVKAAKKTGRK